MSIDLGRGKTLKITKEGRGDYVWSLKVNGEDWEKTWGTMEFVLDKEASDWSRRGERPPSPASEDDDGK